MRSLQTSFIVIGLGLTLGGWQAAARAAPAEGEPTPAGESTADGPKKERSSAVNPKKRPAKAAAAERTGSDANPSTAANPKKRPAKTTAAEGTAPAGETENTTTPEDGRPAARSGGRNTGKATKATSATGETSTSAATADGPAKAGAASAAATPSAAAAGPTRGAHGSSAPAAAAKQSGPKCSIDDPEQPRGGRLDLIGSGFGTAPLVRVAGKPVRMIERREDRLSVQVPADSNGGPVAVQADGQTEPCGTLVIIGKNR